MMDGINKNLENSHQQDILKIIHATASVFNVDENKILTAHSHQMTRIRKLVHFIVKMQYPKLIKTLATMSGNISLQQIYYNANAIMQEWNVYNHKASIQAIFKELGEPSLGIIKKVNKEKYPQGISVTKRLFGFDYSEKDNDDYIRAVKDSNRFWEQFSKILINHII